MINFKELLIRKLFSPKWFGLIILLSLLVSGCAGNDKYNPVDGSLIPSTELAALCLHQDLMLVNFDDIPLPKFSKTYDIQPGEYQLELIFMDTGVQNPDVKISSGQLITLPVSARTGGLYYVYPSFPAADRWEPQVAEFIRPEKLSTYSDEFWKDLEKGADLETIRQKHIQVQ